MGESTIKIFVVIAAYALLAQVHAQEYPSCDVRESRQLVIGDGSDEYKLSARILGSPCYEAELTISIARYDGQELYRYARTFKPHIVDGWSDPELGLAAIAFARRAVEPTGIKTCSSLSAIEEEGWGWSRLLVASVDYERIKSDQCWILAHPIGTEGIRLVAFSKDWETAIPLREFGF